MGQASSLAQKLSRPVSWLTGAGASSKNSGCEQNSSPLNGNEMSMYQSVTPFVFKRSSSMFFDEDGDIAHEFYEEVTKGRRSKMKRIHKHLIPVGEIKLRHPRLNNQLPIIMCETPDNS